MTAGGLFHSKPILIYLFFSEEAIRAKNYSVRWEKKVHPWEDAILSRHCVVLKITLTVE